MSKRGCFIGHRTINMSIKELDTMIADSDYCMFYYMKIINLHCENILNIIYVFINQNPEQHLPINRH